MTAGIWTLQLKALTSGEKNVIEQNALKSDPITAHGCDLMNSF